MPGVGRRVAIAAGCWVLVAVALRVGVVAPERCFDVRAEDLRAAATETVGWFDRNQLADGRWLYRYDASTDTDLGDYNVVRHAGVTMSLYQAHAAGIDGALEIADRGAAYALDNLRPASGGLAFEPGDGRISSGATGLLVAGLAQRRAATGETDHDAVLADLGRFLEAMVREDGSVAADWDPATQQPVPGSTSPFFTGEVYWALALLHQQFPDDGWDEPAERIAAYLAEERDDVEGWFPDISDHWAAYGMSVEATWPDGAELTDAQVAYVERQAGMAGIQVRWESQRTNEWPNTWLRGRRTLGAGLGTLGEQLAGLTLVAGVDDRLSPFEDPLVERTACVAGILVDRQVSPEESEHELDPDRTRGAWFQFGVTQMDDQQHAMSALLRAEPIVAAAPIQTERAKGEGAAPLLVLLAVTLSMAPLRAAAGLRRREPERLRPPVVLAGGAVAAAGLGLLAWVSGPLLDALDSSAPTARIAAGLVLLLASAVDLVRKPPSPEPGLAGWAAAVVPVAIPLLFRPAAAVVAISGGADRGALLVIGGALLAGAAAAVAVAPRSGDAVVIWLARLAAAAGVLVGVALAVDGVYHV